MKTIFWWTLGFAAGLAAGYALCSISKTPVIIYRPSVSLATRYELTKLSLKHGLENTRHCFPQWYYIDKKGQKCLLK
jgi:hypothetical protein